MLTEKLETTKKLDETILEIAKSRELEKEIEDSGEFCDHSCVTSNAESAIAGLPLTADNYKVAIDILMDRFSKPQLLISNYMDALLKLPSVNSVHETKKFKYVNCLTRLKSTFEV
ncbi:hypothetical protein P5673_012023 [Acropora cervicornis]|uniref:Uncharacterized protein n=1 Tax=Acropora cervicornis TaxID=6130 RepID=A0AAD9V7V6_ACRCE|nr:hypothetical protein P5673_012023 [Acropora cervicornis]